MQADYLEKFCLDFVVNREQTITKGEKIYIQTHMAKYAKEFWKLLHHTMF
jgi:sulfite reductase alpha subunit-like flavoprotein